MSQNFYTPEELDQILMQMESRYRSRYRRNVLLCIHEVLNAIDTTKPVEDLSRSAQRCMELADGVMPPVEVLISPELQTAQLHCKAP